MNIEQFEEPWALASENSLVRIGQQAKSGAADIYIYFFEREVLLTKQNDIFHQIVLDKSVTVQKSYCGEVAGMNCYGVELRSKEINHDCYWLDLKKSRSLLSLNTFALVSRAMQLIDWFKQHQFCGACGKKTARGEDGYLKCISCSLVHYPRISPSMIVLITRGEEILLARSPHFPPGLFSALAGFLEPGESVEQCIHREVFEEVAIKVKNLRYQGSQAWPFPHSLMLGFFAEYESGDILCEPGEIEDARWWRADQLPLIPPHGSISAWLIKTRVSQIIKSMI
ncbi:MAG: NAD(+) diphosphatase [Oligoflexales bacterium]